MTGTKSPIATVREYRGMTQDELAKAAGLSKNSVARYESGINLPGTGSVVKLADALDCTVDVLLGRVPIRVEKTLVFGEPDEGRNEEGE